MDPHNQRAHFMTHTMAGEYSENSDWESVVVQSRGTNRSKTLVGGMPTNSERRGIGRPLGATSTKIRKRSYAQHALQEIDPGWLEARPVACKDCLCDLLDQLSPGVLASLTPCKIHSGGQNKTAKPAFPTIIDLVNSDSEDGLPVNPKPASAISHAGVPAPMSHASAQSATSRSRGHPAIPHNRIQPRKRTPTTRNR